MSIAKFVQKADTSKITLGSDVEYFLHSKEYEGFIPASAITDGTKHEPQDIGEGIEIHADNIALEHSVPVSTLETFEFNMLFARKKVRSFVENSDFPDLKLVTVPSIDAEFEYSLQGAPEFTEFGCSPFKTPDGKIHDLGYLSETATRFIGLHIHVGYEGFSSENNVEVIRLMDALCERMGMIEKDKARETTYGISGAYRDTAYGVEYRRLTPRFVDMSELLGVIASLSALLVMAGITIDDVNMNELHNYNYLNKLYQNVGKTYEKNAVLFG